MYGWGQNIVGTLGVGDYSTKNAPTAVSGGKTWNKTLEEIYFKLLWIIRIKLMDGGTENLEN